MTSLIMLAVMLFGIIAYRSLPVNDLPTVDYPTIQVRRSTPRRQPGHHGLVGGAAAGTGILHHRRGGFHDLHQRHRGLQHHHQVRPGKEHRRRSPGCPGGHLPGPAPAPPGHAGPAVIPEGQPGGPAGPLPGLQLPYPAALHGPRIRRHHGGPADLHDQRGGPGPHLRLPEVRGAGPAGPQGPRLPRHRHGRDLPTRCSRGT